MKILKCSIIGAFTLIINMFFQRKGHGDLFKEYEELKSQQTKKRKCGVTDSDDDRAST